MSQALTSKRWLHAVIAGAVTALAQYALQPLPALVLGYQQESGSLTLAPTWTSWWWALSALALGIGVGIARAVVQKWTTKAVVVFVIASVVGFYIVNTLLVLPYLTSEWWALPLFASSFGGAAPLAAVITTLAGSYFRRHSPRYVGRRDPGGH